VGIKTNGRSFFASITPGKHRVFEDCLKINRLTVVKISSALTLQVKICISAYSFIDAETLYGFSAFESSLKNLGPL
jgi:hypothetical protein